MLRGLLLCLVCLLLRGCQEYSKEQQREIDAVKKQTAHLVSSIKAAATSSGPFGVVV